MMIKEIFTLCKMLFGSKPNDFCGVSVVEMKHFPFKGYRAMYWCGCIIKREGTPAINGRTFNHELTHLLQAKMYGSWIGYYWDYVLEWLKGNPLMNPASSAYYTNPFEVEAYANEDNMYYHIGYDGSNLPKYTFKGRKKLYKKVGGTAEKWKSYIKSL